VTVSHYKNFLMALLLLLFKETSYLDVWGDDAWMMMVMM
jgi:hypothetical protein